MMEFNLHWDGPASEVKIGEEMTSTDVVQLDGLVHDLSGPKFVQIKPLSPKVKYSAEELLIGRTKGIYNGSIIAISRS